MNDNHNSNPALGQPQDRHGRNGKAKPARIPLSAMYERVDKQGRRYLSGRIGLLRLLIFRTDEVSEGDPVWTAILAEGQHMSEHQRALAAAVEESAP